LGDLFGISHLLPDCIIKDRELRLIELFQLLDGKQTVQAHRVSPFFRYV
jgi:hypothetical protein